MCPSRNTVKTFYLQKLRVKRITLTHDGVLTSIRHLQDVVTSYRHLIGVEATPCVYRVPFEQQKSLNIFSNSLATQADLLPRQQLLSKFEPEIKIFSQQREAEMKNWVAYKKSVKRLIISSSCYIFMIKSAIFG